MADTARSSDKDKPTTAAKLDTLIRYIHDSRNPENAAAFHKLAADVLAVPQSGNDDAAETSPTSGVGGTGGKGAAADPPPAAAPAAKKTAK